MPDEEFEQHWENVKDLVLSDDWDGLYWWSDEGDCAGAEDVYGWEE